MCRPNGMFQGRNTGKGNHMCGTGPPLPTRGQDGRVGNPPVDQPGNTDIDDIIKDPSKCSKMLGISFADGLLSATWSSIFTSYKHCAAKKKSGKIRRAPCLEKTDHIYELFLLKSVIEL